MTSSVSKESVPINNANSEDECPVELCRLMADHHRCVSPISTVAVTVGGPAMAVSYDSSLDIEDRLSCEQSIHFSSESHRSNSHLHHRHHLHYSSPTADSESSDTTRPYSSGFASNLPHTHSPPPPPPSSTHRNLLIDTEEELVPDVHKHLTNEIELVFQSLSYRLTTLVTDGATQSRQILQDISGYANSGQILAVMGPSGSGKTTLLSLLSGRVKATEGNITLNGLPINKQLRRRIGYVLQHDIFFPTLTLKQTLMYTAQLRLPDSMNYETKLQLVEKLIKDLQLQDCKNTIIGDASIRGLSGGEKKRLNIACELLTNPSVMLIDEPTSGLDSCTAHSLVQIIKNYALQRKKTIIMSVHQPSSAMFYQFDQLLLLCSGQLSYFGPTNNVATFFDSINLPISLHYNPADFILEKVKNPTYQEKIIEAAKSLCKSPKYCLRSDATKSEETDHHHHHHNHHHHQHWKKDSLKSIALHVEIDEHHQNSHDLHRDHHKMNTVSDNDSGRSSWSEPDRGNSSLASSHSSLHNEVMYSNNKSTQQQQHNSHNHYHCNIRDQKWPTSAWTQIKVLTGRNFIEAKQRMLSKLNWIQTIVLAIIAGLIWFQPQRTEDTIEDIRGWMFFTTTYWMLFGLFQALVSFPAEREVVNKERASGAYRLSSYYIAKMVGELPLTVALPSVYFFISYPMMGCSSVIAFFGSWLFLIMSTICAQSVGIFLGAACYDLEMSVTLSALYSLSTMLFAGFYTSMAPWLAWARYCSMVYYAFLNMQMVEFSSVPIECSRQVSKFDFCKQQVAIVANNSSTELALSSKAYIPYSQLELTLDTMNPNGTAPFPIWLNTTLLFLFLVIFRSAGYLILRYSPKSAVAH